MTVSARLARLSHPVSQRSLARNSEDLLSGANRNAVWHFSRKYGALKHIAAPTESTDSLGHYPISCDTKSSMSFVTCLSRQVSRRFLHI
jgi:hypothetical protein